MAKDFDIYHHISSKMKMEGLNENLLLQQSVMEEICSIGNEVDLRNMDTEKLNIKDPEMQVILAPAHKAEKVQRRILA